MAKPDPSTEALPIVRQTTVEWECPFCGNANGIPEITVCGCGAVSDGSTVTSGKPAGSPAPADEPPADTGK